jgi:hypothetical protein
MTKTELKQLILEIIQEELQIASKFWWVNSKGEIFPVGKSEYGMIRVRDMIDSSFILVGYSAKSDRHYMELTYRQGSSPSAFQWKAIARLAKDVGATEIFDVNKNRTVWVQHQPTS